MLAPTLLLLLTLLSGLTHPLSLMEVDINSAYHCHPVISWYNVNMTSVFSIKVNDRLYPGTFKRCRLVFYTREISGRLCVQQRHFYTRTRDVEVHLYDGLVRVGTDSTPDKVLSASERLSSGEWCTRGDYLTVLTVDTGPRPRLRDIDLDLWLYHMQGYQREVAMDTLPLCGSTLLLDRSRVKVTNVDPRQEVKDPIRHCPLTFKYDGGTALRTMCVRFEPDRTVNPGSVNGDFKLKVFSITTSKSGQELKACVGEWSRRTERSGLWCGTTSKISLELSRHQSLVPENSVLFAVTVWDEDGIQATGCS